MTDNELEKIVKEGIVSVEDAINLKKNK